MFALGSHREPGLGFREGPIYCNSSFFSAIFFPKNSLKEKSRRYYNIVCCIGKKKNSGERILLIIFQYRNHQEIWKSQHDGIHKKKKESIDLVANFHLTLVANAKNPCKLDVYKGFCGPNGT